MCTSPGFNSQHKIERKGGRQKRKGEEEGMKGKERAYMKILCHFTDRDIDKVLGLVPSRKRRRRSRGEVRVWGGEVEGEGWPMQPHRTVRQLLLLYTGHYRANW